MTFLPSAIWVHRIRFYDDPTPSSDLSVATMTGGHIPYDVSYEYCTAMRVALFWPQSHAYVAKGERTYPRQKERSYLHKLSKGPILALEDETESWAI